MIAKEVAGGGTNLQDNDDSFLDWETRHETFPFHKHIVAGKYRIAEEKVSHPFSEGSNVFFSRFHRPYLRLYRFVCRHYGACRHVSPRYCEGK